jgi:hypothetical protein
MGQTADELRQEIETKRQDATGKIEQLEQKVTGATDQVMQTKDQIFGAKDQLLESKDQVKEQVMQTKDQVMESVAQAKDQVKEQVTQFDWRKQVDEKPLVALGAAFFSGVVLSSILDGDDDDDRRYRSSIAPSYGSQSWSGGQPSYASTPTYGAGPSYPSIGEPGSAARGSGGYGGGGGLMASIRNAARNSGFEDTISNMTSSFMSTMTDRLRQMADEAFPGMGEKLQNAIQGATGDSGDSGNGIGSGGSDNAGTGSTANQESGFRTTGYGTAAGSGSSMPSSSDYARSGELSSSLTNS